MLRRAEGWGSMSVRRLLETVGGVEEHPYKRLGRSELMAIEGLKMRTSGIVTFQNVQAKNRTRSKGFRM